MVTIKDIAKLANVSHTTVSRALNDNSKIKEDTRNRIKELAKELGYVPNMNAKSLFTRKSYVIGLFFSTMASSTSNFITDVLQGAQSVIDKELTISVHYVNSFNIDENLIKQSFDGIIIMSQSEDDIPFIAAVKASGVPIVVLNRSVMDDEIVNIVSRDKINVIKAINYGIQLGHTKIGIIEGKREFTSTGTRKSAFAQALKENNIPFNPKYCAVGDYTIESGQEAMETILAQDDLPTLIFACNDDMAIGAINTCVKHNLRVPEDISFIGFDDIPFSKYCNPPLTTINRPVHRIASTGASYLTKLMDHEDVKDTKIYINTEFKVRESVKKLN